MSQRSLSLYLVALAGLLSACGSAPNNNGGMDAAVGADAMSDAALGDAGPEACESPLPLRTCAGTWLTTSTGVWCAVADAACTTGWRWDSNATGMANTCVSEQTCDWRTITVYERPESEVPSIIEDTRIIVAPNGRTLISFSSAGKTIYSELDNSAAWTSDAMDGLWLDMALAPDGTVHLVYAEQVDTNKFRQVYAERPPGVCEFSRVKRDDVDDQSYSLAVAPDGRAHVASIFSEGFIDYFHYSTRAPNGDWDDQPAVVEAESASVAVDDLGGVHLAITTAGDFRYRYRSPSGTWTGNTVATSNASPGRLIPAALAVDSANQVVHMVWVDGTDNSLKHGSKPFGASEWTIEPLGGPVNWLDPHAAGIDAHGGLHVAYTPLGAGVAYLYKSPEPDTAPVITTLVPTEPQTYLPTPSLFVDPAGTPSIVYIRHGGSTALRMLQHCPAPAAQ